MSAPLAPCYGMSVLFDATDLWSHEEARQVCATCPLIGQCRELVMGLVDDALHQSLVKYGPEGTWAGALWKHGEQVSAFVQAVGVDYDPRSP